MENWDLTRFYNDVRNHIRENGIYEKGQPESSDELYLHCRKAVSDTLLGYTYAEVRTLDTVVADYQVRYNIIGSVHKTFFENTANGKQYRYLYIEQVIQHFEHRQFRFMDWLLENFHYMDFSEELPKYLEFLNANGELDRCIEAITGEVCRRLNDDN